MIKEFVFQVYQEPGCDRLDCCLLRYENGECRSAYISAGHLAFSEEIAPIGKVEKPLLSLPGFSFREKKEILSAIAIGLKDFGVEVEVDEKKKAVALAVASERKDMLEYFKELNNEVVRSTINQKEDREVKK